MKKTALRQFALAGITASSLFVSGCAVNVFPGGPSVAGGLITNVTTPAQSLTVATDVNAQPTKEGSASASAVLGLVATGDASVKAAMDNGGIKKVHNVDHTINSILFGLYIRTTTTVHGE